MLDNAVQTVIREEDEFWTAASQSSLDAVWGDSADNVYARLLDDEAR